MSLAASSVLTLAQTQHGKIRVSFLIGEHPPHELVTEDSDREGVFCSVLLDGEGLSLLPGLEREALERVRDLISERLKLAENALRASRGRSL